MIKLICFLLLSLVLFGCGQDSATTDRAPSNPTAHTPPGDTPDAAARMQALTDRLATATLKGDEVARLQAAKDITSEKLHQAELLVLSLRLSEKADKAAIADAHIEQERIKIWWFVGMMGLLALASAGVAIFVPSVARWAIRLSIAAGVVAGLASFVSWLLPYLVWIGAGVSVVAVVAAIVYWRLDAKSRDQVVQAFESVKGQVPGYRDQFNKFIDTDADKHLDSVRSRLGLKKA